MGSWANGTNAKQLGTGRPNAMVWVGFDPRGDAPDVTLSVQDDDTQLWVELDIDGLLNLRKDIDEAIAFLADGGEDTP